MLGVKKFYVLGVVPTLEESGFQNDPLWLPPQPWVDLPGFGTKLVT
jgi:hypothetical protein